MSAPTGPHAKYEDKLLVIPQVNTPNYAINVRQLEYWAKTEPTKIFLFRSPEGEGQRTAQRLHQELPFRKTNGTRRSEFMLIPRSEIHAD
jgi:hypothetical protein